VADADRDELVAGWDQAAAGWAEHADHVQRGGMPISTWMLDHAQLQPGHRVLELAAGPGDTGFLAAELVSPGGVLVCSDASEAMLAVARRRAEAMGIRNVEFRRIDMEWIDLETASVDAVLCRWGYMLVPDPEAALRDTRRVLRPGGRVALAVWGEAARNPRLTIVRQAAAQLAEAESPEPGAPDPFALSSSQRLRGLLDEAGFLEVEIEILDLTQRYEDIDALLTESLALSPSLADLSERMGAAKRRRFEQRVAELADAYVADDGSVLLPGRSLVAAASA
jgi:ubiquinone/menaquinone biosynthesis C-methylase UbiE